MIENDGTDAKVTAREARRVRFALALATGTTVRKSAELAGISEATGYRWAGDAEVAKLANHYRNRMKQPYLAL